MPTAQPIDALLDDLGSVLINDPGPLDPTSPYYVPNLHGTDADDLIQSLARTIRRTNGSAMYYFSGQRGTGKSTELRRLMTLLNGDRQCRAYLIDALDFISDTHPIELIDLMLVIALAFAERLREDLGHDFLNEPVGRRFNAWLQTDVQISGLTVAGVKAEFRSRQQSLIQRIRQFDLESRDNFVRQCSDFVRDMAVFVKQRHGVQRVIVAVDSLERLRGIGADATDMFDRVVNVFDGGIASLRLPELQMIYSVPPYLPYLINVKAQVPIAMLASVRVCEPPATARRRPRESGLATMRRVVDKRCAEWPRLLSPAALDRLIVASGGDIRQLLKRLLLDVVDQAYYASDRLPLAADDAVLQTVYDRHRIEFEQMVVQEEYPLLRTIADGNTVDLPRRSDLPTAARFFDIRAVLNYRNGVDWVDLNPLLWPLIDGWTPPVAAPSVPSSATAANGNAAVA